MVHCEHGDQVIIKEPSEERTMAPEEVFKDVRVSETDDEAGADGRRWVCIRVGGYEEGEEACQKRMVTCVSAGPD